MMPPINDASSTTPGLTRNPEARDTRVARITSNALLLALAALFLLPMLWLIFASVDSEATWSIELPHFTLSNFAVAFNDNIQALLNSVILASAATVIATVTGTLSAYALSRRRIPWKGGLLLGVLFLSGIPLSIVIIPVYQMFASIGWLSIAACALFLSVTLLPFEIYLIKNFIDAVPEELEEAARIERAGTLQVLRRVVLPLSLPGIGASAILGFVGAWGSFLVPLVLIASPDESPASVTMFAYMAASRIEWGHIAAFSLIYSIPVFLLYAVSSRLFSGGFLLGGAVRG